MTGFTRKNPAGLWSERFELLDAWRGLAALAVVVHHVAHVLIGGPAVMVFFVISGYCIAASADSCQRKGLGFGRFMQRRIKRIYPPYLLSVIFWAFTRLVKWSTGGTNELIAHAPPHEDLPRTGWHWLQNLTLTQWVTLLDHPIAAAASNKVLFVSAYWSLCYEEQFYILIGLMVLISGWWGKRGRGSAPEISASAESRPPTIRAIVLGLVALGLVWNAIFPQISYGVFIEYWAMFGFGAMVYYRLCRLSVSWHRRLIDASLLMVFAGAVYLRWFAGLDWQVDRPGLSLLEREDFRMVYQELAIASGFALLLIAMRPLDLSRLPSMLYRPLTALGQITFSLYLIHQFNLKFGRVVVERILAAVGLLERGAATVARDQVWYSIALQIIFHIGLASVFWYFCERPFLNKSLLAAPKPPAPAA